MPKWPVVEGAGSKLKTSSRSVGANELADTCHALGAAGEAVDWEAIDELTPRLGPLFAEARGYIEAL